MYFMHFNDLFDFLFMFLADLYRGLVASVQINCPGVWQNVNYCVMFGEFMYHSVLASCWFVEIISIRSYCDWVCLLVGHFICWCCSLWFLKSSSLIFMKFGTDVQHLCANFTINFLQVMVKFIVISIIIIIMTRSDQPEPPAVAIVRQNGLSSASSRASVTDTPVSRQIWWTQVGPESYDRDLRYRHGLLTLTIS